MTQENEPTLVKSDKSQRLLVDGCPFSIEIIRLETEQAWTLEVVDQEGTSHVWAERFLSDSDARNEAIQALETAGAKTFMQGVNTTPLRQP